MNLQEIITKQDTEGSINIVQFSWEGNNFRVTGIGRRWLDDNGEHLLVMVEGDRILEIVHTCAGDWLLVKDHSKPIRKHI